MSDPADAEQRSPTGRGFSVNAAPFVPGGGSSAPARGAGKSDEYGAWVSGMMARMPDDPMSPVEAIPSHIGASRGRRPRRGGRGRGMGFMHAAHSGYDEFGWAPMVPPDGGAAMAAAGYGDGYGDGYGGGFNDGYGADGFGGGEYGGEAHMDSRFMMRTQRRVDKVGARGGRGGTVVTGGSGGGVPGVPVSISRATPSAHSSARAPFWKPAALRHLSEMAELELSLPRRIFRGESPTRRLPPQYPLEKFKADSRFPLPRIETALGRRLMLGSTEASCKNIAIVEFKRGRLKKFETPAGLRPGQYVMVDSDRGVDCGMAVLVAQYTFDGFLKLEELEHAQAMHIRLPLEKDAAIRRVATSEEVEYVLTVVPVLEQQALNFFRARAKALAIDIRVVDCELQFDGRKLTFFYHSEEVVDFRDLVREMFHVYGARIWLENLSPSATGEEARQSRRALTRRRGAKDSATASPSKTATDGGASPTQSADVACNADTT